MTEPFPYPLAVARVHAALVAAGLGELVPYAGCSRDGVLVILPADAADEYHGRVVAALPGCVASGPLGVAWVGPDWGL